MTGRENERMNGVSGDVFCCGFLVDQVVIQTMMETHVVVGSAGQYNLAAPNIKCVGKHQEQEFEWSHTEDGEPDREALRYALSHHALNRNTISSM